MSTKKVIAENGGKLNRSSGGAAQLGAAPDRLLARGG
jgi:hypothetical protein